MKFNLAYLADFKRHKIVSVCQKTSKFIEAKNRWIVKKSLFCESWKNKKWTEDPKEVFNFIWTSRAYSSLFRLSLTDDNLKIFLRKLRNTSLVSQGFLGIPKYSRKLFSKETRDGISFLTTSSSKTFNSLEPPISFSIKCFGDCARFQFASETDTFFVYKLISKWNHIHEYSKCYFVHVFKT